MFKAVKNISPEAKLLYQDYFSFCQHKLDKYSMLQKFYLNKSYKHQEVLSFSLVWVFLK